MKKTFKRFVDSDIGYYLLILAFFIALWYWRSHLPSDAGIDRYFDNLSVVLDEQAKKVMSYG